MPSVVVLTYDHPHRKTEDVLSRLALGGYLSGLSVVATPWVERKERKYIYGHRPSEKDWPCESFGPTKQICQNLGVDYTVVDDGELASALSAMQPDVVAIGGAGILPKDIVVRFPVLNVHPGLLPARRGLDVFKWSILDCKPVGVTSHLCDTHTDLGRRILEWKVPVFRHDSLHSFAMRQYEYELGLFAPSVGMVLSAEMDFEKIHPGETKAFRRMPVSKEAHLLEAFERYKLVYA